MLPFGFAFETPVASQKDQRDSTCTSTPASAEVSFWGRRLTSPAMGALIGLMQPPEHMNLQDK